MNKLVNLIKKVISNELFLKLFRYVFIGGLTTLISFGIYWVLCYPFKLNPNIANIISIICAVIFAYVTNKTFVFKSKCSSTKELVREMISFFASRGVTMFIEIGGVFVLYTLLVLDAMLSKIIISIFVLILNYILSQYFIFKTREHEEREVNVNTNSKNFLGKYGLSIIVFIVFIVTLMINLNVRIYGDDFFYTRFTSVDFGYFIKRHIEHYKMANGRVIVHLLATTFLGINIRFWQIINSLMLAGIVYFGSKTALGIKKDGKVLLISASIIFSVAIGLLDPNMTRQSIYWLTGSFNYVYPILMLYIYWYLLARSNYYNKFTWILPILGFLSAATQEQNSLMTFGLTVLLIFEIMLKKQKVNKVQIISLITTMVGMLTVIASPAVLFRASIEERPVDGLIPLLKYNIKMQGTTFLFSDMMAPYHLLAIIAAVGIIIKFSRILSKKWTWLECIIIVISSSSCFMWLWQVSSRGANINYNLITKRALLYYLFIGIGYILTLLYAGFIVYKKKLITNYTLPLIAIILGLGSQFMMIISPVYGPRNLVSVVFMLTLYAAALIPVLNIKGISGIGSCFLLYQLNLPWLLPLSITAIVIIYNSYNRMKYYKILGMMIGYSTMLIASLLTLYPTFNGFSTNAKVYDRNLEVANEYLNEKREEGLKEERLTQNKLPHEIYGWAMPYHNAYYDPYYKLYIGVDMKTNIDWH